MRVMVSLNLADIMTAIRPTTPQEIYEMPNTEDDPPDLNHEPNSEKINAEGVD